MKTIEIRNEIRNIINYLNKNYSTSYKSRFEHIEKYFKKKLYTDKDLTEHIKQIIIDKDVTLELCEFSDNTLANARKTDNIIQINKSLLDLNNEIGSGYKREDKILKENVNNQEQFIIWVICHEYCHLLYPDLGHTNKFFKLVEKLYKDIKYFENN